MRCDILMFAQLADAVGADRVTVEIVDGATVADVMNHLAARHQAIADARDTIAVAVDERYCAPETPVRPGQVIALIPPVSGG